MTTNLSNNWYIGCIKNSDGYEFEFPSVVQKKKIINGP